MTDMTTNMGGLGVKYGTDKVTHHKYDDIFPRFIDDFRDVSGGMIEIGVAGGESIRMWLDLFPHMNIYGIDVLPIDGFDNNPRVKISKCDQSNKDDLVRFTKEIRDPIHFINDDGSHIPEHILSTFNVLFPMMEENGIYIIEDVEVSYWRGNHCYGYPAKYGYRHPNSIVEIFKTACDFVNYEFMHPQLKEQVKCRVEHLEYIHSITFAKNCIVIVKKKNETYSRKYRFENNL